MQWLGTVEERARAGRERIKRDRNLWSGAAWKDPDVFLIRHIADVLNLPLRISANANGPRGPLLEVMKVLYDVLHRLEKAERLPWKPSEKEMIGTVDSHAIQYRIRKAQQRGQSRAIDQCVLQLRSNSDIPPELKPSLEGRLRQLRQESIGQALRRLVRDALPNQPEASQVIDDAYALRSQLIHSGVPADLDVDLERESQVVSRTVRALYASLLNRPLARSS
jgi:hypothetical protein